MSMTDYIKIENYNLSEDSLFHKYIDTIAYLTDANDYYHFGCAAHLVASFYGSWFRILVPWSPEGLIPNVWIILVGPSRVPRKTASLNNAMRVFERVVRALGDEYQYMPQPDDFSPEGLIKFYDKAPEYIPAVAFIDEIGGLFETMRKDYMAGSRPLLSKMYSQIPHTTARSGQSFYVPRLNFNILGTMTTPITDYVTRSDFTTGFLNRFLFIFEGGRKKRYGLTHIVPDAAERLQTLTNEFVNLYMYWKGKLDELGYTHFQVVFDSTLAKRLDAFEERIEQEIIEYEEKYPHSLWRMYASELPKYVIKLLTLYKISKYPNEEDEKLLETGILIVSDNDWQEVKDILLHILRNARKLVNLAEVIPVSVPYRSEEAILRSLLTRIHDRKEEGLPWSKFLMNTGLKANELATYTVTLMERGEVRAFIRAVKGRQAKPTLVLVATKYAETWRQRQLNNLEYEIKEVGAEYFRTKYGV